jgi:hypothetical protein
MEGSAATGTTALGRSRPISTQTAAAKSSHRHTNRITHGAAPPATELVRIGFAFGWRIDRARLGGEGQVEDSATSLVDAPHGRSRYRDYPEGGGLLERSPPRRRELAATRTIPGDGPSGVASVACSRPGPMTVGAGAIAAGSTNLAASPARDQAAAKVSQATRTLLLRAHPSNRRRQDNDGALCLGGASPRHGVRMGPVSLVLVACLPRSQSLACSE